MIKKTLLIAYLFVSSNAFSQSVTQEYIKQYQEKAVALMTQHGVPASITLAVAMHESASGTSKIARHLNNHFGLKGPNSNTQIRSAYRDFTNPEDSFDYFITFLQSRSKLKPLFDKYTHYDYKNWAKGIQRGGYAASRSWASQVISMIKKHNLQQYDNRPADYVEPVEIAPRPTFYTVKKGDTLGAIAKKRGSTVSVLMQKNRLKSSILQIGQKLKL